MFSTAARNIYWENLNQLNSWQASSQEVTSRPRLRKGCGLRSGDGAQFKSIIRAVDTCKHLNIKPEVHNVSQRHHRRTEPLPQGICTPNFVKIGPAVRERCSRTNRHTYRHTDRQTNWSWQSKNRDGILQ